MTVINKKINSEIVILNKITAQPVTMVFNKIGRALHLQTPLDHTFLILLLNNLQL